MRAAFDKGSRRAAGDVQEQVKSGEGSLVAGDLLQRFEDARLLTMSFQRLVGGSYWSKSAAGDF